MTDELRQARELFVRYSGSLVQMHREGALKKYEAYGIAKETEQRWLREQAGDYLQRLSIRDGAKTAVSRKISRRYSRYMPVLGENA